MSHPIPVDILSDSDQDPSDVTLRRDIEDAVDLVTPPPLSQSKKKQRTSEGFLNPCHSSVLIIDDDDDSTPYKKMTSSATPSFVAETPFSGAPALNAMCSGRNCSSSGDGSATQRLIVPDTPISELLKTTGSITKFGAGVSQYYSSAALISNHAEINQCINVESDNESEHVAGFGILTYGVRGLANKLIDESEMDFMDDSIHSAACDHFGDEASELEPLDQILKHHENNGCWLKDKERTDEALKPKRISKEERARLMEEKKQLKEQEKLLKAATKAQAAEMKKRKKEMQKWEKGKYAQKSIVAEIDRKVIELGSIGGNLLTRFAEKGITYRVASNPIERSIVWTMVMPEEISAIGSEQIEISYVLIVHEAEEFCNLVSNGSIWDHVCSVQRLYPHHTICYLTNRLMAYINKMEQAQYKNPATHAGWKRPAIEEVLAKLATHFFKVHTRQCVDEAELAEHVVGLTCSLASCHFRKKLTRLSVNANGLIIPKDTVDKNLIKKNLWLKALVSIPKVQPRFAISIWKKYPTMKSLLTVYMDPTKSVHEKEFLLKDLTTESLVGDDRRLGEVCSKRIYRILMAQCGNIKTEDVENGADFFSHEST